MNSINFLRSMKSILVVVTSGLVIAVLFAGIYQGDGTTLERFLEKLGKDRVNVSAIITGDWDYACVITETASPNAVATEIAEKSLEFEEAGNSNRNLLFDGETGLVLVSKKRGKYALFLVFSRSRISFDHNEGPQCLPFGRALLAEKSRDVSWRYFELLDCGSC